MKYQIASVTVPQNKRKDINEKILHIINNNLQTSITAQDIYNGYTGEGGLHGLSFSTFENFHQYTEAKKEIEQGQFFTPHTLSKFLVDCLQPSQFDLIADLTCGMGNFFNFLPNESNIYGNELDIKAYKVAKHLYPEAHITHDDIRNYNSRVKFDIVLGNPPYNLKIGDYLSQLYYCVKAADMLKPAGILALIMPNSFLSDEFMDNSMIKQMDNLYNFVCQFDLPVNAFKNVGVDHFETKIMIFQKKSEHITERQYTIENIYITAIDEKSSQYIYQSYVKPLIEQKEKVKAKLFFENLNNSDTQESIDFKLKVTKMLFDIKRNPKINKKYADSVEYVNRYYTQKKPDDMKYEEWQKIRITKNKVISYLKRIITKQHYIEQDKIELVKTAYGLKLKGYSQKNKIYLSKLTSTKQISFNDMIVEDQYPFADQKYMELLKRKENAYNRQNISMKEMDTTNDITAYVNDFCITDDSTGELIQLNDIQKTDISKILQKNYSILNWQQGSGKTLAGIAWYKYLYNSKHIRNIFIVSAALSINMTWDVKLKDYKENYIKIKSLKDIDSIKHGQIVIISFDMLTKYQRQIKKYIKQQSQKVALIVDESDELTNRNSQRTKATLNCFRRVKYKLLTTGTTTRNNINELYPQLELLYNNSINLLCDCEYIHKYDKKTDELKEEHNERFMTPFPAHYGQSLFKACYCPSKVTVFGVKKDNQDIYNSDSLKSLIEKTIITRKFKDIVGKELYEITPHYVSQNSDEQIVYAKIMKEFYQMVHYFRSTGNSRKDSMLRIIRQIQLLIKSTSIPHKFKEYTSDKLPNKYYKIFSMVEQWENEKVAIGTVFLDAAIDYYNRLKEMYPNRSIFLIKGDVAFNKRKSIIQEFEATQNGILISTQQSLKSSVNIPTCNKVIIESMQWNMPKLSQYFFRFIRYNSKDFKQIHFVTYDHTIEQNLLALLMVKERLNEFIKTLEYADQSEIFEEYGIDLDILENIIEKEKDKDGKVVLTWGKQRVVQKIPV